MDTDAVRSRVSIMTENKSKSSLVRLGQRLRRWAGVVPPTGRGWLVAGLAGFAVWRYGFGQLDLLLFMLGLAGLLLVLLSAALVGLTALYVRRRVCPASAEVLRFEAGVPIRTGFSTPSLDRLPLIRLLWTWRQPAEVEVRLINKERRLVEEAIAPRRCQVAAMRRRFVVRDVFGLCSIAWGREDPTPLTVLPNAGRLRRMPVVQSMAAAEGLSHPSGAPEGDRMEIRRYTPGDSVRHIMWKTFARTRILNVRTPERSVDHSRKTVAYLIAGPGDEPAAAAARVALEAGALGERWLFGADGASQPTATLDTALAAIARSGSWRRNGEGGGLGTFLREVGNEGEVHCIIFAPARGGGWTREALGAAHGFRGGLSFVLGTDGVARPSAVPLWRRLLFATTPEEGTPAAELNTLLTTLGRAGFPVLVVDRASGRSYGEQHQRALGAPA